MRTENETVANKPLHLMTLPNGKKYEARALGIADALEWSETAEGLHDAYANANGDRKLQTAALWGIIDCVAEYPGVKPDADEIKTTATSEQIVNAFYALRDINDPFAVAAKREERSLKKEFDGVKDLMAMLPDDQKSKIVDLGIEKLQTR